MNSSIKSSIKMKSLKYFPSPYTLMLALFFNELDIILFKIPLSSSFEIEFLPGP